MKKRLFLSVCVIVHIVNFITIQYPIWLITGISLNEKLDDYFNYLADKYDWYYE